MKARKFVCASIFDGEPKQSDFELQTEELPALQDGGIVSKTNIFQGHSLSKSFFLIQNISIRVDVLVETIYWSVDPYQRVQMPKLPVNSTMIGENIARLE